MKSFFILFFIYFTGDFMLYLAKDSVCVDKYKKIINVSDNQILYEVDDKKILITGENLLISYYEKDQFNIIGRISKIEIIS